MEEVKRAQEARAEAQSAGASPRGPTPPMRLSVRALLLAGAYPLVPRDALPQVGVAGRGGREVRC